MVEWLVEEIMNRKLSDYAEGKISDGINALQDTEIVAVRFFRVNNRLELALHNPGPIPFKSYLQLRERLQSVTGANVSFTIDCDHDGISNAELVQYFTDLGQRNQEYQIFVHKNFTYEEDKNQLTFLFSNQKTCDNATSLASEIEQYLQDIGLKGIHVLCSMNQTKQPDIKNIPADFFPEPPVEEKQEFNTFQRKNTYHNRKESNYTDIKLHDVEGDIYDIKFDADVFSKEEIVTKKQTIIQNLSVYDGTDAILVKRFEGRGVTKEDLASINEGDRVSICGKITYDSFSKDMVCSPDKIVKIEKSKIVDDAPVKRVEWHMHTNMSEMDAVCKPADIVNYAYQLGLGGVVITDHADVQSLAKAFNAGEACKKKDPNRTFKVGLGCEMNMVDDQLLIVRNCIDKKIDDEEYVSFDLETTGLSCYYDSIIEFGAVKVKNQTIGERLQMFIKPPFDIPPFITNKTNITNDMVKNAKPFAECIDQILDWIGDDTIVAHNATFDYHFLNEELRRIGRPPMKNCVIDTLDMSRAVLRDRRAYRLGNVARNYHVAYDEETAHRADYDAETLASVFLCLLKDAKDKYDCVTIKDLQKKTQDFDVFKKMRHSHICVVAKNQSGVRDLYKLVSESNTRTLAVMGKNAGKEGTDVAAEARILRSSLQKARENLLFGSACQNNEIWELACNGDDQRLEAAMKFYDYIELQPLANYTTYVALGNVPSLNRVKDVQKRIIAMAEKLNIPVIADSDAHYLSPDQKIFRDIYIMSQGVGGVTHPLYIRDEMLRKKTPNPDQHLRTTPEMKKEFAWLEDEQLIDQIVVQNPNELFTQLEEGVRPVPSGTFPPHIPDSDTKLRDICNKTAKDMYEFEGKIPEIVMDRLNMELDNIIKNGYDVHYYIAHLLVKKSNEDGYLVGSRGSVGSSFTATMSGITEVNPLKPHYLCPHCHYSEWIDDPEVKSGFDLEDKKCPKCGETMHGNGQNIPFQTFLGFNADKVPDIDLNFSNEYQWRAHKFIKEVFGENHAFRAGTIGGVADKTAYGYVSGYCEKMDIEDMRRPMKDYLAKGCTDVKRTTGQHPGGIIIIPEGHDAEEFTPVQYPANDPTSSWKTTHYDFHDIHDNVLKFDILGHVDPTAMRLLQRIADVKPLDIPMNDPETLSLFYEDTALHADPRIYKKETGAVGLPEFGTRTTRRVLEETKPHKFSELVMISGLSHGTDVWAGNAESLVQAGHPLSETIACRDDIMTYLLEKNLEPIDAFKTMEDVRKGRGLRVDQEENMKAHHVPDWYIESCKKIKYMFPKAHAVAYVMMAIRIAWYKVHEPLHFYIQYLTLRCDAYELETMMKGIEAIRARMEDIQNRLQDKNAANPVSNKEKSLYDTLEICEEIYARGFSISNVDLYQSQASEFTIDKNNPKALIPPFTVIDGLGANVAVSIMKAAKEAKFLSKEDLIHRTQLSSTMVQKLDMMGILEGLQDRNQISLF